MLKCSPVEMRKNLEVVDQFRKHMIDFVAISVLDAEHKAELIRQGAEALEKAANTMEEGSDEHGPS